MHHVSRAPLALLRRVAVDVRPLQHSDFRRLFIGQGVSFIGFQLTAVAVPVQMFGLTRSSFWVGLIGLAALLPLVVFGLYGGAISDAVDRRLLYICVVLRRVGRDRRTARPGTVAGATTVGSCWCSSPLQTVGFAVSAPVRGAITPRLIPPATWCRRATR